MSDKNKQKKHQIEIKYIFKANSSRKLKSSKQNNMPYNDMLNTQLRNNFKLKN